MNYFVLAALGGVAPLAVAAPAPAPEPAGGPIAADFDSNFFNTDGQALDLERYRYGTPVLPGNYRSDIRVNGFIKLRETVTFIDSQGNHDAKPCLGPDLLARLGIAVPDTAIADAHGCINLRDIAAEASASFMLSEQRLDLSIPQVALLQRPNGYIDPALWDSGVTAATLSYSLNSFSFQADGKRDTSTFLSLNAGLNLGDWRLRQYATARHQNGEGTDWNSISAYAERSLPGLQAQLTLGDSNTTGEMFGGLRFRGARIATDDRMLPQSMRGYAPTIRGVANSNARVQIHQNDVLIHDITVAPGAFQIDDLPASGYSGDLVVTITESDGSSRSIVVPYASVTQLLRPGYSRFSATAGTLRDSGLSRDIGLFEGTWQRGLSNTVTGFTGVQATSDGDYQALLGGLAFNTPIGAISLDTTATRARLRQDSGARVRQGHSSRLTYSNRLSATNTSFSLAAYRYSTEGYRTLQDTALLNEQQRRREAALGTPPGDRWEIAEQRQKSTFQLNLFQPLGQYGTLYISGSTQNYWNRSDSDRQYMAGYSHNLGRANYGLSASRARLQDGRWDNQVNLNVSVALGGPTARRRPIASLNVDKRDDASANIRAGITGSLGQTSQFGYGANIGRVNGNSSYGANATYHSGIGSIGGGYTHSNGNNSYSANLNGAVVAFAGGVVLAPQLGDTIGVIEAKGATGTRTGGSGSSASRIDRHGHAVLPYLSAYQQNTVELNPLGSSLDFELKSTSQHVVPNAGAVVKLKFEADTGRAAVIQARQGDGTPLPFGADVYEGEKVIGVVGQGSRLLARVSQDSGTLRIAWNPGGGPMRQCLLDYQLPALAGKPSRVTLIEGVCRATDRVALTP